MVPASTRRPQHPVQLGEVGSSFTPRVIAVILIILFVSLGWMFYALLSAERQQLFEARREMLAEQVRAAISVCREYDERLAARELTRSEAMAEARRLLLSMRYGPSGEGHFYVLDSEGRLVAHPMRPDLEGGDVRKLTDGHGTAFVAELLEQGRRPGGAFVSYRWRWRDGATNVGEKLAYVGAFEPWNWLIVTDATTADIYAMFRGELIRQLALLLMVTLVLAGVLSATLRRLVLSGIDRLIEAARRLAAGDLSARVMVGQADELNALAVAFNQMAEGMQARDERIRLSQRAAVYALAKLADVRDHETGGHLLRVREYATTLALALRSEPGWRELIDRQFIADLYDASMLHDVGKVGIPDQILHKPETLDEEERAAMMSHTLVGADTIGTARKRMQADSGFLVLAEQIARSHHERWDGEGYAERLAGEQIPPVARIFAVADVYDALTTHRPYKPAYSHRQAVALMAEERGRRFDPVVFDAFLSVADRFDEIRREFADL